MTYKLRPVTKEELNAMFKIMEENAAKMGLSINGEGSENGK
jgi:hypothetical protein